MVRNSVGIWTRIFHRRQHLLGWPADDAADLATNSGTTCWAAAESLTPGPVASFQYEMPDISAGEGVFMLASSHAWTSRMTLESGRAGRMGGSGGVIRSVVMGLVGNTAIVSKLDAFVPVGAVCGRCRDTFAHMSVSSLVSFPACRDTTFCMRRCSHFFAVPPYL